MSINIGEHGISVTSEKACWMCGDQKKNKTNHHCLPQTFSPKKNVQIPLCKDCHEKLHKFDLLAIQKFMYRLSKESQSLNTKVARAIKDLSSQLNQKDKEGEKKDDESKKI